MEVIDTDLKPVTGNFLCRFSKPQKLWQDVNWSSETCLKMISPSDCVMLYWVLFKLPSPNTHLYFQLYDLCHCLDYLVQRRLEITAQYDLRCSLLADNVVRSTVQVTADSHSAGLISTLCKQGKYTGWLYHSPYTQAILWIEPLFSFSWLWTWVHSQFYGMTQNV